MSRRHARLVRQNGALYIEDLSSFTGVRVNGAKIGSATPLREGDEVQIGDYRLALRGERTTAPITDRPTMPAVPAVAPPPAPMGTVGGSVAIPTRASVAAMAAQPPFPWRSCRRRRRPRRNRSPPSLPPCQRRRRQRLVPARRRRRSRNPARRFARARRRRSRWRRIRRRRRSRSRRCQRWSRPRLRPRPSRQSRPPSLRSPSRRSRPRRCVPPPPRPRRPRCPTRSRRFPSARWAKAARIRRRRGRRAAGGAHHRPAGDGVRARSPVGGHRPHRRKRHRAPAPIRSRGTTRRSSATASTTPSSICRAPTACASTARTTSASS